MTYTDTIRKLLDSDLTSYRIAKDIGGLSPQYLDNYRVKGYDIRNMTLNKAEKLVSYQKEMDKMNKGIKNFAEEIWENLFWEGMEAVLYKDGDNWIRQQGSRGVDEEDVVYTLPLSFSYWSDSSFMCLDEDDEPIKDERVKEDFIEDMESQIRKELDL